MYTLQCEKAEKQKYYYNFGLNFFGFLWGLTIKQSKLVAKSAQKINYYFYIQGSYKISLWFSFFLFAKGHGGSMCPSISSKNGSEKTKRAMIPSVPNLGGPTGHMCGML